MFLFIFLNHFKVNNAWVNSSGSLWFIFRTIKYLKLFCVPQFIFPLYECWLTYLLKVVSCILSLATFRALTSIFVQLIKEIYRRDRIWILYAFLKEFTFKIFKISRDFYAWYGTFKWLTACFDFNYTLSQLGDGRWLEHWDCSKI